MGLFSSKKKGPRGGGIDTLPDLGDLPELDEDSMPQFPVYEPSFGDIKSEVSGAPIRSKPRTKTLEVPMRKPVTQRHEPLATEKATFVRSGDVEQGKPLFIKIDKYKSALANMDVLRKKITDAEKVLREIDKIRTEEERTLEKWRADLSQLKEKLLQLDEDLFEL